MGMVGGRLVLHALGICGPLLGKEGRADNRFYMEVQGPPTVSVLRMASAQGQVLDYNRLARHGLDHQAAFPCCGNGVETMQHLMTECAIVRDVCTVVCRVVGKPEWTLVGSQTLSEWC